MALTRADVRAAGARALEASLRRAWDIIADQEPTDVVLRFRPGVATRVARGHVAPDPADDAGRADGSLVWRATVAGTIEIRLWILSWGDDVEVLEPAALRDDVAGTLRRRGRALRASA